MSVPITRDPAITDDLPPAARLALTPAGGTGPLDGAWWPRSRELGRELPSLAEALDLQWGHITRVMVNPAHWPVIPRRVRAGGRALHIGWCIDQDPNKLLLRSYSVGRWDLLVIPPQTAPDIAAGLLRAAADPGNRLTASDLLARVGRLPSAAVGRAA